MVIEKTKCANISTNGMINGHIICIPIQKEDETTTNKDKLVTPSISSRISVAA